MALTAAQSRLDRGVTLVELVIFIVVTAIAVTGVLLAFAATERGGPTAAQRTQARVLADSRMELVLAQKNVLGFDCFNAPLADPCEAAPASTTPPCPGHAASTAPLCTVPTGYLVAVSVASPSVTRRRVAVQVQGPGGLALATVTGEVDGD